MNRVGENRVKENWHYQSVPAVLLLCLAVAGCGPSADEPANGDIAAQAPNTPAPTFGSNGGRSEGEIAFLQCAACHTITENSDGKTGPSLLYTYDQKAGQVEGYNYSAAMAESDVVWDRQNLSDFLAAPNAVVPGTKMIFAGLKDETKRAAIIDYLEEVSADRQ